MENTKKNKNRELFENAPVSKAVLTMGIPTIVTMLVIVIYNMADTFFIGQTGDALQVAAVSLATPVFLIMMALGNLFGIGGSSAISRAMGAHDDNKVHHISSFCFYTTILVGLAVVAMMLLCMEGVLKMIGTSADTVQFAKEYLTWISLGAPFIMLSTALGNIVRSEGAARESMIGNMIGTITNIVLDPLMILTMHMGVAGAAIATVIGNVAACIYYLFYLLNKSHSLSIRLKDYKVSEHIPASVMAIGVPASLNNILMSIANIILNNVLASYGDVPVAAMGVAMKANMLVIMLQIGLCTGIQPLIGYNYGAKNVDRLRKVFRFTACAAVAMGTLLTIVLVLAKEPIIRAFIDDEAVVTMGMNMMVALQISGPVIGILFLAINTLQGMGKALPSLILTICRQGIVFIPMVFILNAIFGLDGVIYAQTVADFVSILLGTFICLRVIAKLEKKVNA